ncbi:OPT oligopeptide transporter protein-domain-containing protein [Coniochaeta sp. 2T2.1]|nr:OPT oligopeptide transporter protein-domain-containing protein [Coniochaeta sp. 2T2.1]
MSTREELGNLPGPGLPPNAIEIEPLGRALDPEKSGNEKTGSESPTSQPLRSSGDVGDIEKPPFLFTTVNSNGEVHGFTDDDPLVKDIPAYVRRVVNFEDDPKLPTITFRYFLLTIIFVAPGAFLSQMSHLRTTFAPYSVFFVQIASSYLGDWLAKVLPARDVRIPFTSPSFSLNHGPFSVKEHVLVTISAASGATYNLGYSPISMSELYFGYRVNPAVAIFFMWAIVWFPWFKALCQTALFETQKKQREHPDAPSRKQIRVFFLVLVGIMLWHFLPEYVFPMLGSLAFLCWVAPHNPVANFVGADLVIIFAAFAFNCWVLLPAARFGKLGSWDKKLMFNPSVLRKWDFLSSHLPPHPRRDLQPDSLRRTWSCIRGHAVPVVGLLRLRLLTSAIVWMAVFGYGQIKDSFVKLWARRTAGAVKISEQFKDQLNVLQRSYQEVPLWWYAALFTASFIILLAITATDVLFIPWWTFLVAIATGALVVVPLGWLYALSNFQLLLYGLMVNSISGYKNPCGASTYGSIAGDAWYRAQLQLQDMKIGHYMHIPPRDVFFAQILGSFIGVPINYGVMRWVLSTKADYLRGDVADPTHQWTGQSLATSLSLGVQYVFVGPRRLFRIDMFSPLPNGFLVDAGAPLVMYALNRSFPKMKFRLWNTTIFFSQMSVFYGNISTGYTSSFNGGAIVMFWAFRYRYEMWARWNYILAAAFDAGFNFAMLLIFLFFGSGKITTMPNWWGNNADSSERCFGLE